MKIACLIPIYNYAEDPLLESNHLEAIKRLSVGPDVDIFTIRGTISSENLGGEFVYKTNSVLWQKEALINKGISQVKGDYDIIAWIDSGLFLDSKWVDRVREALESKDVVQCYSGGMWLNEQSKVVASSRGYMWCISKNIPPSRLKRKPSVGGAWAARSEVFDKIKLYDRAIVGGGDTWFVNGVIGADTPEALIHRHCKGAYRDHVDLWLRDAISLNLKSGFIKGYYRHLWHTSPKRRRHLGRHQILKTYKYNPTKHIEENEDGLLEWSEAAPIGMVRSVEEYILGRYREVLLNTNLANASN